MGVLAGLVVLVSLGIDTTAAKAADLQAVNEIIADATEIDDIIANVAAEERMPKKAKQKFCKFCNNPSKSTRNCKWQKDACKRICKIDPCSLGREEKLSFQF